MNINYTRLSLEQITEDVFSKFNRYQEVTQCWRKENGTWVLKDISFVEDWTAEDKGYLVECLRRTADTGGAVMAAVWGNRLLGFASVESEFFGTRNQYLQLSSLHTDCKARGKGIGKRLFAMAAETAKSMGAEKLYISSHSARETQGFYKSVGCVEAEEINEALVKKEPCDCQLEFDLTRLL